MSGEISLVECEFYLTNATQDERSWVFQVLEVLHSLDLPPEVFAAATPAQQRQEWYLSKKWEKLDGSNDLGSRHGTAGQEGNPYEFQRIGDTEEESNLKYAQPTYDRMGELMLHDYAEAKVYHPASAVLPHPVFVFHWRTMKRRSVFCNGMRHAYVAGCKISGPDEQPEELSLEEVKMPNQGSTTISRTEVAFNLPFQITTMVRKLASGTDGKFTSSDQIRNVSLVEWQMLKQTLGMKTRSRTTTVSRCGFSSEFIHWTLREDQIIETMEFTLPSHLRRFNAAAGLFWNCCIPKANVENAPSAFIEPTSGTRIKVITPTMRPGTEPEVPQGQVYRAKRTHDRDTGATVFKQFRAPGVRRTHEGSTVVSFIHL